MGYGNENEREEESLRSLAGKKPLCLLIPSRVRQARIVVQSVVFRMLA